MKRLTNLGFTLIEALIVVAVSIVLAGIAIPVFMNAMNSYYESATVSAVSGAISAVRFQAIMKGYAYEIVFTPSTLTYQIFNEVPPATTFSLVVPAQGSATTPLPNAGKVVFTGQTGCTTTTSLAGCTALSSSSTITYTFSANGTVTVSPAGGLIEISNTVKKTLISVSGVGNVSTASL